jgi:D-glycero-D-manno-heptose 1,7-bisphosphate phosphatase
MKCAVFLERDGVLNRELQNGLLPRSPACLEEFKVLTEAARSLAALRDAGLVLLATTNQPGISAGTLPRRELDLMHRMLLKQLPLDGILVCPHAAADHCPCRKPKPGLMLEAAFRWHLDLDHSFIISKMWHDAEAAHVAGCTSVLIRSPWNGSGHHDYVVASFADAVARVLRLHEINHTPHGLDETIKT